MMSIQFLQRDNKKPLRKKEIVTLKGEKSIYLQLYDVH